MPPVISFVVGFTTIAPRPVAAEVVAGFSWAPESAAERITVCVVCAAHVIATLPTLLVPVVPAPFATVHLWFGAITVTL